MGDFVSNIGRNLGLKYLELLDGDDEQEPPQTRDEQKKEKVAKELTLNFKITRFRDYQDIADSLKRNSPEEYIESINLLSIAIGDSRRKIVYYSALQGELLKTVKESTTSYNYYAAFTNTNVKISCLFFNLI